MGKRGAVSSNGKRTKGVSAQVSAGYFPPSDHLNATAIEFWNAVVCDFPVGHFTERDRVALEQYCIAAAAHKSATLILQKEGVRYKDSKGIWHLNPMVAYQRDMNNICAQRETKLRITKTSMISPKSAGRAAQDATDTNRANDGFGGLLFGGSEARQ